MWRAPPKRSTNTDPRRETADQTPRPSFWNLTRLPDIGRRTWWLVNTFHLGSQGRPGEVTHHSWNRIDPGNYGINTDGFTRAALAANAREYGDEDSAQALEASL